MAENVGGEPNAPEPLIRGGSMTISLQELGDQIRAARDDARLSQEALAAAISPPTNRSVIAHLEQGRRLPVPDLLQRICEHLKVPTKYWRPFQDKQYRIRLDFEEALGELTGRPVTLRFHDENTVQVAQRKILALFPCKLTSTQAFDEFNSILIFYDTMPTTRQFFLRFLGTDAFRSTELFLESVREYQKAVIRLFSTFSEAYDALNTTQDIEDTLRPLKPRSLDDYISRTPWYTIEKIPQQNLPYLGYIAANQVQSEKEERGQLATFLRTLADAAAVDKGTAISKYPEKTLRRMESLLRKFHSRLQHGFLSPLFMWDPDALRREAEHLAPKNAPDIELMEQTQAAGINNLARYLAADHLDIYVATSMRVDADFISVNNFVNELFDHSDVSSLNLRYFNPTQSWIKDRVAKGLVEALMLKRCSINIYMAQKGDTFGKDSEASVALGQGKPVIVYVPRLFSPEGDIDSEQLWHKSKDDLRNILTTQEPSADIDDALDHESLFAAVLASRLRRASPTTITTIVKKHWADFDLYGEDVRIKDDKERASYREWLDDVTHDKLTPPTDEVREHTVGILTAVTVHFEKRARLFREQHPLALQVILSTGVLNGILVARSVNACAHLLRALIRNDLDFDLDIDEHNYRLVEKTTRSTMRVIPKHTLIANSFTAFYARQRR